MAELTLAEMVAEAEPPVEIPSIFLPGTDIQFAWDATSIEYLKRCPRLYYYKMRKGYVSNEENVHLRFGAEVHTSFHQYQLIMAEGEAKHDEAVFHVIRELMYRVEDWNPDHKYKNRFFLIRSVIRYLDKYVDDNAKTVIQSDGKPAVELSFSFELDYGPNGSDRPYVICGYLDRVVDFQDQIFVMDHKTTTTTPSAYYWNQFEPNTQMSLYTLAGNIIFQTNIKGVIIDSGQLLMDDTRFSRGITYRTQDQLDEWLTDLQLVLEEAELSAKRGYWRMNDTACDKYGGCKFREICSKSPGVRDRFLKGDFKQEPIWNPLIPR